MFWIPVHYQYESNGKKCFKTLKKLMIGYSLGKLTGLQYSQVRGAIQRLHQRPMNRSYTQYITNALVIQSSVVRD